MPFLYEVAQHKRDRHEYMMITGFEGSVSKLVVPDTIDGMAVEAIGNHAFSGRQDIEEVVLPESIKTLFGFAFHNCRKLRKITLFDSLDDYYDGVCRQCDNLEEVEITINNSWYEVIRNFLADNDKTLRFKVHAGEEEASLLTFPEYVYDFNENTMARTIQFSIAGSGYAFRECVDRRKMDYSQYDSLFEKAIIDGSRIAQDIAIGRLLYPLRLEERFRSMYEKYISDNGYSVLENLLKDISEDRFFSDEKQEILKGLLDYNSNGTGSAKRVLFTPETMDRIIRLATSMNMPSITAMLMNAEETGPTQMDDFTFEF